MSMKPYQYALLEGVAQEMRKNKDICYYWEYATPVATKPNGEVINIPKEFGGMPRTPPTVSRPTTRGVSRPTVLRHSSSMRSLTKEDVDHR